MRDLRGAPVETEIRVRYAETDAMGVVHHAAYLVWFEVGRTEYTRAAGLPYREVESRGVRLVVVEAGLRLHAPARYDDRVVIRTAVDAVSKATLTFIYEARRADGTLLAEGRTVHAATDLTGRLRRIPEEVRAALGGGGRNPPGGRE
jgi:acyl-CoA thioester hydrolase